MSFLYPLNKNELIKNEAYRTISNTSFIFDELNQALYSNLIRNFKANLILLILLRDCHSKFRK